MSFSGIKYRRVRCDRVLELCSNTISNDILQWFTSSVPIVCFTRLDERRFTITLQTNDKTAMYGFKLDEEMCHEKKDGTKIKIKFTLEGDNVLNQIITLSEGKIVYMRREFYDNYAKMTVNTNTTDATATIYFEVVS